MSDKVTTSYDFSEDAMGLGDFIEQQLDAQGDDVSLVVYVQNAEGCMASRADWVVSKLTDGSKVAELIIHFDE